jgi:hypothetical protein
MHDVLVYKKWMPIYAYFRDMFWDLPLFHSTQVTGKTIPEPVTFPPIPSAAELTICNRAVDHLKKPPIPFTPSASKKQKHPVPCRSHDPSKQHQHIIAISAHFERTAPSVADGNEIAAVTAAMAPGSTSMPLFCGGSCLPASHTGADLAASASSVASARASDTKASKAKVKSKQKNKS